MKSLVEYIKEHENELSFRGCAPYVMENFDDYCLMNNIREIDINEKTHYEYLHDFLDDTFNHGLNDYSFSQDIIVENLLSSTSVGTTFNYFKKIWKDQVMKIEGIRPSEMTHPKQFYIVVKDDSYWRELQDKDDPTLKSVLAITNYFIINIKDDKILLHPYKPIEKTELIYEEYDGIVYHVTTKECWEEIQKKGLSPKGRGHHKVHIKDKEIEKEINDVLSSSYLPEHIYVMASKNFKAMRIEANMLSGTIMRQKSKFIDMRIYDEDAKERMKKSLDDLVMIKVNLKKSPIRYKIWEDPTCKGYHAYFLTEYIPPMIMAKIEDKEWKIRKS